MSILNRKAVLVLSFIAVAYIKAKMSPKGYILLHHKCVYRIYLTHSNFSCSSSSLGSNLKSFSVQTEILDIFLKINGGCR